MRLSQNQIAGLAASVGVPSNQLQVASAIAMAESGGDTNNINPGHTGDPEYSVGLWQINIRAHPQYTEAQMKDPVQNAQAMFKISNGGTQWSPAWGTYTNGSYKNFMMSPVTPIPWNTTAATLGYLPVPGGKYGPGQATPQTPSNTPSNPAVTTDVGSGYKYILAYAIAIAIFVFIAKFKPGYVAIYYALLLCVILLMVLEAPFIYQSLKPLLPASQGGELNFSPTTNTALKTTLV